MDVVVFLGAPGSGKGTQAKRLADSHGYTHLSTGDMLRAAIREETTLGKKAKGFLDRGELVPDDVMIGLIEDRFGALPKASRVLLDGFPRTMPQAEVLDEKPTTEVGLAVHFKLDPEALVVRLTGRRTCKQCGEPFHVKFLPPKKAGICDKCGGELVQRSDDTESVVRTRIAVFQKQNQSLLDYYKGRKILRDIDADRPVDVIRKDLAALLSSWFK